MPAKTPDRPPPAAVPIAASPRIPSPGARMFRSPLSRTALALASVLTLAGCGDDDDGPTGGSGRASLRVTNQAARTILFVYISPCSDPTWGEDRLGDATIAPGASFSWSELPSGCYDLRADLDDDRTSQEFEVQLRAGQRFEWRPPASSFVAGRGIRVAAPAGPLTLRKDVARADAAF
jgi:hypothetical protein